MCVPAIAGIVVIVTLCSVYYGTLFYAKIIQNNVFSVYSELDKFLSERYELISYILSNLNGQFNTEAEKIQYLKNEAVSLGTLPQNIDRRAAFDRELAIRMNEFINILESSDCSSDDSLKSCIQKYGQLSTVINNMIVKYNLAAHKLKTLIDVFPSSFVTRLNRIRPVDLYKEV